MSPSVLLASAALTCLLTLAPPTLNAKDEPSSLPPRFSAHSMNVRDFGAKGDGTTDDTAAIQAAINAANRASQDHAIAVKHWRNLLASGTMNVRSCTEVVFPAGHYRISDTLVLARQSHLRGLGSAVIEQLHPEKDTLYFHESRYAYVENLSFQGGKIALRFWTNNLDNAEITVRRCTFTRTTGYALECHSFTEEKLTGSDAELDTVTPWAPYRVRWSEERPYLSANPLGHQKEWFNSTILSVTDTRFIDCRGVADLQCDTAILSDCEFEGDVAASGPVFHLPGGITHLYRIKATARRPDPGAYWIEGGGILSARELDFDTATDAGIDFIRVSRPLRPSTIGAYCVDISESRLKVGGSTHNAICWIAPGNQPNLLSLRRVTETSGREVQAVQWAQVPTVADLEALIPPNNPLQLRLWFRLQFSDNSPNIQIDLPEIMAQLREKEIPIEVQNRALVPELTWDFTDLAEASKEVILAEEMGLDPKDNGDATETIRKIFAAAAKLDSPTIIFPAGLYRISDVIELPDDVVVQASGLLIFAGQNPEKNLFSAANARQIGFKGVMFTGGKNALNLHGVDTSSTRIAFENCSFMDQVDTGVRYLTGSGGIGEKNLGEISLHGGTAATRQALVTNASRAQVSSMWFTNDPHLDQAAFIENLGGDMRVQACLTTPKLWEGKRHKRPAQFTEWALSRNTRWIDNYGRLYALDNRFGGESGGMANVFQRASHGTLFIDGGITRFMNGVTTKAIVFLEKKPELLILQNISSVPVSLDGSTAVLSAIPGEAESDQHYHAGVLAPFPPRF